MMVSTSISNEERRQALERVLVSRTFSRSDQLRAFLRYICEADFEGHAQDLNEYVLGVSVLGRSPDYSPAADSCVRTRAYELRNKLKSYYQLESPDDPVRIEIRKGGYAPQFQRSLSKAPEVETDSLREPADKFPPASLAPFPEEPMRVRSGRRVLAVSAIAGAMLLAYLAFSWVAKSGTRLETAQGWSPEMSALWSPFLSREVPLIVSYEKRLFFYAPGAGLLVRDSQVNQAAEASKSQPLTNFRLKMKDNELHETFDYADFGAVHAAFLLGGLLMPRRGEIGLKQSDSLGWEDFRNSNIVFLGKPNLNPSIRYSLQRSDFVESQYGTTIRNLHPLPGEPTEYQNASTHGAGEKYALVTVLPGPKPGRRIMILSGAGSEFVWALAEYVTQPTHVKDMMRRLRQSSGEYPSSFQVLIRGRFESYVPVEIGYVTHRILNN